MNLVDDGATVAYIMQNNKKISTLSASYDREKPVDYFNELDLSKEDNLKFQVVPNKKNGDRTAVFIVGKNRSGKSYWIRDYLLQFIHIYPGMPIYLFSSKLEDPLLDNIPNLKRVPIDDSFIQNPMHYKELSNAMSIFDDVDSLRDKLKYEIYLLRDAILKNGRSACCHIICTNHDCTGRDIKACLTESDIVVFFLANYNRSLKYMMEGYIGLDKKQTDLLRQNKTRATAYVKSEPTVPLIIQEKNAYVVNALIE